MVGTPSLNCNTFHGSIHFTMDARFYWMILMAVIPTGVTNMVASTVSWLITIVTILIIVKIVQLARSAFGGAGFGSGGGKSGGKDGSSSNSGGKDNDNRKASTRQKEREKFEQGIENPAYLQVWVRGTEDQNIQGAKVSIRPLGRYNKKKLSYEQETNPDGLVPGDGGYLPIPSNFTTIVSVRYRVPWKSRYRSKGRTLTAEQKIILKPGQEERREFKLSLEAEEIKGIIPYIVEFDYDIGEAKGKISSSSGR